ncbi:hypothetical protein GX553_00540 [Candidatus Peribacteria bacterium]|nr:hypothetical protein [Candidatus Peribacteria bacterium]
MEHTHFTSGGVAERRLIYAMDAPDGMGQSESYDQPEKADPESMDSLLPNSEALAGDPDAEVTLEAAAVENTDAELEAPRKTLANAQAVLEGMQADSTEQTEDPTTKTLDVPVDTDASAELVEDATAPVPEEQLDVPSPSSEEMQDPETARLTGEIDLGIQELKEAKTPGEALAAIGKLFAAITEMIRRIFAKGEKQEADGGGTAEETAPGDLPKEPKAEQAPEEDERVRSADSLEKKKEALTVVGNESKETLENNHTAIKDIDTEIGTLEGQKTTLDEQIAALQSRIDSAEDAEGSAKRRILQTQLEGLKKQAASMQETIDAHTTHRNELVAENEALQKKIEAAEQAKDRVGFTLDAIHKVEQVLQEKFGIEAKTELNDGKATFVVDTLGESTPDWLRTFLQENDQNQNSDDGYQIDLDRAEWLSKAPQDAVPSGDEKEEQSSEFALDAVLKTVDAHVLDGNGRKESGDTAAASEHYAMGIAAIDQALSTLGEETSDYAARDQLNSRKAEIQGMIDALPSNVQPEVEPDTSDVASADADTQERSPEDLLAKRQEWAESIHQKSKTMKYPVVAVHVQEDGRIAMHFDTTQEGYVQKLERAAAYAKTRGIYSENIENVLMVDIAKKHETKGYFGEDFDQQAMDDFESKLDDEFAS